MINTERLLQLKPRSLVRNEHKMPPLRASFAPRCEPSESGTH